MSKQVRGSILREHYDAQDNYTPIVFYPDGPLGPMVAFDSAGFLNHVTLRAFVKDLLEFADLMEKAGEAA